MWCLTFLSFIRDSFPLLSDDLPLETLSHVKHTYKDWFENVVDKPIKKF